MMMRKGHEAMAGPFALGTVWVELALGMAWWLTALSAVLVQASCMLPDLDHPAKRGPAAAIVQWVAWAVWKETKTSKDRVKSHRDTHRDFTHTIEGCACFGLALAVPLSFIPYIDAYAWILGASVSIGCLSHLAGDAMTPSGVPLSATLNMLLGKGTWARYCVGRRSFELFTVFRVFTVRLPVPWVVRASGPKRPNYYRGLFKTNSATERVGVVPALWAVTICAAGVLLGLVEPIVSLLTGLGGW